MDVPGQSDGLKTHSTPPSGTEGGGRCAYCGAPLPAWMGAQAASADETPKAMYCCYGCRVLGESEGVGRNSRNESGQPGMSSQQDEVAGAIGDGGGGGNSGGESWVRVGFGALMSGQAMMFGLAVNLSPPEGEAYWILHGALWISAMVVLIVLGLPLVRSAWSCACQRRWSVEWLFLSGIVGALGASTWATWTREGAVYYEVVAVLLTVYTAGRILTARARARAFSETRRFQRTFGRARVCSEKAEGAGVVTDGGRWVDVEWVEIGDFVRVDPGEAIPVDGVIASGTAYVVETPMSGEPFPVVRRIGDEVLAGSFSEDGTLLIRATAAGRNRRLDGLLMALERARSTLAGTRTQMQADKLTGVFLPLVWVGALGTMVVWSLLGDWQAGLFHSLSVLLVACPCALGLATPLALWNALGVLAARGWVIRRAEVIEKLADVDMVYFDKTGTLSEVQPTVVDWVVDEGVVDRSELRRVLGLIQMRSSHPVARAFALKDGVRAVSDVGENDWEVVGFKAVAACGVEAWVRDREGRELRIQIGRREWFLTAEEVLPGWADRLRVERTDGVVCVARDGVLVGVATVREQLRTSGEAGLREVRELGCAVGVLTGDRKERAIALLKDAGIDEGEAMDVLGGMTPSDKVKRIEERQGEGRCVLFVGDGINDSLALGVADVGVALRGGADLARESADAVLAGDDLREISHVLGVARRVRRSIRGNLLFALTYNGIGMGLAATGHLHPVMAAFLMLGSSAVVSWRAVRGAELEGCEGVEGKEAAATTGRWRSMTKWGWGIWGVSLWVQGLLLQVLGEPGWGVSVAIWTLCGLGSVIGVGWGWGVSLRKYRGTNGSGNGSTLKGRNENSKGLGWSWGMLLAMVGPGNVGMLLGWWADAGFGPVMREGVCLCCSARHYFGMSGGVPWMYVGMLALGIPAMWPFTSGRRRVLVAGAVGMVLGMAWGAERALAWAGPGYEHQFWVAFGGMSLGMLAGMGVGCGLGEAAWALGRRKRG